MTRKVAEPVAADFEPAGAVRRLAVLRRVAYGLGDDGAAGLRFLAMIEEGKGELLSLQGSAADLVIQEYQVRDVRDLEGRACWVLHDEARNTITFEGACLI